MDHIPLPKHPLPSPDRVPLVCDKNKPYDEGDFATYPGRANWHQLLEVGQSSAFWLRALHDKIDDERMRKQEVVLQSWLFFGHLHAMLAPFGLYNAQDYIDDGLWLHTRDLQSRLAQWHEAILALDANAKAAFLQDAKRNYSLSAEPVMVLNNDNYAGFNRMIKISVLTMCGTIEGTILRALDSGLHTLSPFVTIRLDKIMEETMLSNGWCPMEVNMIERLGGSSPASRWYLTHMVKPGRPGLHSRCSKQICRLEQIDLADYHTRHVDDSCSCESLGPSMEAVLACLRQGRTPVLEVIGNSIANTDLKVHAAQDLPEDTSYIALSHVWADGLGNPIDNALPACQLQWLKLLISGVENQLDTYEYGFDSEKYRQKKRFLLWCDTLCCPVDPIDKQMALAKMRDYYLEAAFVLVLDQQLLSYKYEEIGILEAGWRLLMSRYMRRLWTYQEAGLAVKLLLQFDDVAADLLQIIRASSRMYNTTNSRDRLWLQVAADTSSMRRWRRSDLAFLDLREAITGIAHRNVSVKTDEPLCLATVLGYSTEAMAEELPGQRMRVLWDTIARSDRGLRMTIIFNTLPRLQEHGFHWAPASVLQPAEHSTDVVELAGESALGILLSDGLRVRCAGWRINAVGLPGYLPDSFWPKTEQHVPIYPTKQPDGTRYHLMQFPHQGLVAADTELLALLSDRSKEWFVILHRDQTAWEWVQWLSQRKGLLVSKETSELGLTYYKSHMILTVDRVHPTIEPSQQVDSIWADRIRWSWALNTFNGLSVLEKMLDYIGSWLPASITTALTKLIAPAFSWGGRQLGSRLRIMMRRTKSDAPRLAAAAAILRRANSEETTNRVGGTIISAVMGRCVRVDEVYDESTEWIVD